MNRRSFLQISAGATAAAMLPISRAAAAPKRKLRKAIMWNTIGVRGTVLEKCRAMKEAGFEGVEPQGAMNREEVIAALKETGLQAASVCDHIHWLKPLSAPDEATRQIGYDGLIISLEDAKAYGATSVLLVPGIVAGGNRAGVPFQECWDRSIVEIRKAIPTAQRLGVKIAIENVGNNFINTPEQAAEYLKAINSEWVMWHFDIGNHGRLGPPENWIKVLGKQINRIHIKEFVAATPPAAEAKEAKDAKSKGASGRDRPKLLEGDNNWSAIMAALDSVGYTGWAISEQPGPQAADVESARDLAQRMDKIFAL
ncbi:MAG TPA: TIM barrel protein [Opitutaceae bacterium]|nr:TIM barrel protein [Opitutaceae bacterium]